jgi:hypothetical protein
LPKKLSRNWARSCKRRIVPTQSKCAARKHSTSTTQQHGNKQNPLGRGGERSGEEGRQSTATAPHRTALRSTRAGRGEEEEEEDDDDRE